MLDEIITELVALREEYRRLMVKFHARTIALTDSDRERFEYIRTRSQQLLGVSIDSSLDPVTIAVIVSHLSSQPSDDKVLAKDAFGMGKGKIKQSAQELKDESRKGWEEERSE